MKRQLKKSVVYSLYAISFVMLISGVGILLSVLKKGVTPTYEYVSKGILDYQENIKVVNSGESITRPYTETNMNLVKGYYDYKAESESQEKSLIYYEDTYIQSSGVSYSNGSAFDVVSVLPGTVKEVKEDDTLGNVITIEHANGIVSIYQSVSDILVKAGDQVMNGQKLAKSSTSNISKELENHLYFELVINGECVNPEEYYDKTVNEI